MTNFISFEYCSLSYLNQWLVHDMRYCRAFEEGTREQQLEQLQKASKFYRVARNAHRQYDVESNSGLERFEPILDIFDTISIQGKSREELVNEASSLISARYGGRGVLSLTTKFLWLKLKSPIIIYDSQARKALGLKGEDYSLYCSNWIKAFEKQCSKIESVSARLPQLHKYAADQRHATPEYISSICNERWFHERIFDNFLWQLGI